MSDTSNTAPTPEEVLQDTPTPDAIKAQVEAQMRIHQCGATLGFMAQQAQQMIGMLTANNPRMGLAIANELVLLYDETMRRSLIVNDQTGKNIPVEVAADAVVNAVAAEKTEVSDAS